MKFLNITLLGLLFILLGVLVGHIIEGKVNKIEKDIFDESKVELLNAKSRNEYPFKIAQSEGNTILVYINPTCYTRVEYLEDWYNLSKNINNKVVVILTDELIFYLDYLVRVEKRYDEGIYLFKSKNIHDNNNLLKSIGADEAVFIINNNRDIFKAFKGPGVPDSLVTFLDV